MSTLSYWILRCEHRLLVLPDAGTESFFPSNLEVDLAAQENALHVGELSGHQVYAMDVAELPLLPGCDAVSLRAIFSLAGPEVFALAGRATQLLDWQRDHRFCGRCSTPTVKAPSECSMLCPNCGQQAYPRISPAVMVLVRDGERLLLARSPHFKPGVFSALAGFVEPGETLEACAKREVREEVGIEITNLRYFDSQSWPFPNSLMLAFFADYAGGELVLDPNEIEAAGWFEADNLPILPEPISISRRLIEAALFK